jgi:2-dehydro-3-deoxygluconokinase
MTDILSIGEPMIEFNQTKPGASDYLQGFGGDSSNMIVAAARQGARTAYFTRLGDDEFGRMFRKLWADEKVEAGHVPADPAAPTAVYFVQHGEKGHVFSYLRAGSAASRMKPEDLPEALLKDVRFVHASGISLAISLSAHRTVMGAFEKAKKAGAKISFDSNLRPRLWPVEDARKGIAAAAKLADYFFPSLEDAEALSGLKDRDAMVDWAHRLGAVNVFLKLGADGVLVSNVSAREWIRGRKVKSVDATGAGDCFCGAVLARLAAGDDVFTAARYANAAAALATTGFGAVAPIPRAPSVMQELAAK